MRHVTVNKDALDAFVDYAQGLRDRVTDEFCCGYEEAQRAQKEFDKHVKALSVKSDESHPEWDACKK